jgi:phosphoglycolate phosphatase
MRYDGVIFDLDGTLIDSSEGIVHAAEETISELGYPKISREELASYIGPPIGNSIIARNGFDENELKRFNSVFREKYKNKYLMEAEAYPGVMELLRDLKGSVFIGIATNKRIDYTVILLENMGISQMCDDIQGLDMEGKLKKEDIVDGCIRASGIADRRRIVVIGDTKMDEAAAKKCGTDFIGVTFGFGLKSKDDVTYGCSAESVQSLRDILFS